ncbi:MAG: DUF721 domain-containing protein [Micavibrio sp.]|nr:MAG: DUF721 domain-containing protein [Micavibrio sp.]
MSKPRLFSSVVPGLAENAFGRKSALLGKILSHWDQIAGAETARRAKPAELHYRSRKKDGKKIREVALSLYVCDGSAALELQFQTALLIEKINMFAGYDAICEIRFQQAPEMFIDAPRQKFKAPEIPEQEKTKIRERVASAGIEDEDLRAALEKLGAGIAAQHGSAE